MMKKFTWDKSSYIINGERVFLISGECHYFRVPKERWREVLQNFKDLGGNCVATYVPWILHEPSEGEFRFSDVPERDLEGFLQLCAEMRLYVICRPGPYTYSELKYDGLPGWLCQNYPEILAEDISGKPFRESSVSYVHSTYWEKVSKWYNAVCPIIAKYQLGQDGSVAMLQLDNELTGVHVWFNSLDYNKESMGFGLENGRYPIYLRNKYKDIEALNNVYETDFINFSSVKPCKNQNVISAKDYLDFYFKTLAEYVAFLADLARSNGINCTLAHNAGNTSMLPYMDDTLEKMKSGFLIGADHYYMGQDWKQNSPTPQAALQLFCSSEILLQREMPPTVMEMQCGCPFDWPPVMPKDMKSFYMSAVAFGMKGFNYYVFAGGATPFNMGRFNPYDYYAPISYKGEITRSHIALKEFSSFLCNHQFLSQSKIQYDFAIGCESRYAKGGFYDKEQAALGRFTDAKAWSFLWNGITISAFCGGYMPQAICLERDEFIPNTAKPLFVTASSSMSRKVQKKLIDYISAGGKMLIAPEIPYLDEDYKNCTLLSDFIGAGTPEKYTELMTTSLDITLNGKDIVFTDDPVFCFKKDIPTITEISYVNDCLCGLHKSFENGGEIIWLGYSWSHSRKEHSLIISECMALLGAQCKNVKSTNENIWAILHHTENSKMLFLLNLFTTKGVTSISLAQSDGKYSELGNFEIEPFEVKAIVLT